MAVRAAVIGALVIGGFQAKPPPSSRYFLALPQFVKSDPVHIFIPEGPLASAAKDLTERQAAAKTRATKNPCEATIQSGILATRDKNFESAETFFKRAINDGCDDGFAGFYLASLDEESGHFSDASARLPQAIDDLTEHYPGHRYIEQARATLGRVLFRQQRYLEATPYLMEVVEHYPQDLPHHVFAGQALCRSGASAQGIDLLKRALLLAERMPKAQGMVSEVFLSLAEQSYAEGQLAMSREYLKSGLKRDEGNERLKRMLSQVENAIKNTERQRRTKGLWGAF